MAPYCVGGKEILHSYHQCMKGPISLHAYQHWMVSVFGILISFWSWAGKVKI